MFNVPRSESGVSKAVRIFELIYHAAVHDLRKSHTNALMGLFINVAQTMMLVAVFYLMFAIMGMRSSQIRGDFLLYIMSGIFIYMTQIKSMGSIVGAEGAASPMMQHAPMSTFISIMSHALSALYIQLLSVVIVVFLYDIAFTPVEIYDMSGVFGMIFLAWFSGCAIGLCFYAIKPWMPGVASIGSTIYSRANMIASGKMFVANTVPWNILVMFTWNPLFHIIDQARGFMFINYNPQYSNWHYPLIVSCVLLIIGFMGESYTRKHASLSWGARG